MKHNESVTPPSADSQPEISRTAAGNECNEGMTRRSFSKRSGAATLGTFLGWHFSQTTASASSGTGGGSGVCTSIAGCAGYTPKDGTVYIDKPPGPGVVVTYFTIGKCKCTNGSVKKFDSWQKVDPPAEQDIFFVEEQPGLRHTAGGHSLPNHSH